MQASVWVPGHGSSVSALCSRRITDWTTMATSLLHASGDWTQVHDLVPRPAPGGMGSGKRKSTPAALTGFVLENVPPAGYPHRRASRFISRHDRAFAAIFVPRSDLVSGGEQRLESAAHIACFCRTLSRGWRSASHYARDGVPHRAAAKSWRESRPSTESALGGTAGSPTVTRDKIPAHWLSRNHEMSEIRKTFTPIKLPLKYNMARMAVVMTSASLIWRCFVSYDAKLREHGVNRFRQ